VPARKNPLEILKLHRKTVLGIFFKIDYSVLQILQEEGEK
jgi:hypothetical protein